MSLRHRARPLSAQTRGPYSVRPWSAAVKNILFFKLPDGHRSPPNGAGNRGGILNDAEKVVTILNDEEFGGANYRGISFQHASTFRRQLGVPHVSPAT